MTIIWSSTKGQTASVELPDPNNKDKTIHVLIEVALGRVALSKSVPAGSTATYRRTPVSDQALKNRQKERETRLAELRQALADIAPSCKAKEIKSGNVIAAHLTAEQIQQVTELPYVRAIRRVVSHRF